MSLDLINLGAEPNDGTGDTPRAAGQKMNDAITALDGALTALDALAPVAISGAYTDLEGLPFIPAGFTYDQQAEPLSPLPGQTWRERSAGGLTLGFWEWSGSLWLSNPKATTGLAASITGASTTVLAPLDYLGVDSVYVQGVHYCVQTVSSTGNLIIQLRGLRGDGGNGAELGAAFYSSGDVVSTVIKGYQSLEQVLTAPNVFGNVLGTYTRTLGSGSATFLFTVVYRNIR